MFCLVGAESDVKITLAVVRGVPLRGRCVGRKGLTQRSATNCTRIALRLAGSLLLLSSIDFVGGRIAGRKE